jgi:3-isopropylmalate/(R)-2-methylmalate dehydratase large subunit
MPELGFILPGLTVVCGDSHTSTHGAFGCLAFGVGSSEIEHVLATQTITQPKPKQFLVLLNNRLSQGCSAKDLALSLIARLGPAGGTGYALEYAGAGLTGLSVEERLTLCNMSIECGARMGLCAPDEKIFNWLKGRPLAPTGHKWNEAEAGWRNLKSDEEAIWDGSLELDLAEIVPRVTWGTTPAQNVELTGIIPPLSSAPGPTERSAAEKALEYQGLKPGQRMADLKVDYVFLGSCTNSRLPDLQAAAALLAGRKIASHLTMLVSPGSRAVKEEAERLGLDDIFIKAGAQWREPGCSMCLGLNGDLLPAGKRSASTSNRNFEDRQGRGGLTHLVSPQTAAATALAGYFRDPRDYL